MTEKIDAIKSQIDKLEKMDKSWREKISDDSEPDELNRCWSEIEKLYYNSWIDLVDKEGSEGKLEKFQNEMEKLTGGELYEKLEQNCRPRVKLHKKLIIMRDIGDKGITFLNNCIIKAILRWDEQFLETYEEYGFQDSNMMTEVLSALESVFYSHVSMSLTKETAQSEFKDLTGFDDLVCETYAEIYERYYNELQTKYLFYMMEQQWRQIGKIMKRLDLLASDMGNDKTGKEK